MIVGYFLGVHLSGRFTLPAEALSLEGLEQGVRAEANLVGLMSARGWMWIVLNNVRALALATVVGIFSLGVGAELLLMAPLGTVGYIAGNLMRSGQEVGPILAGMVLPHAIFEIPAAAIAGGAILRLGMALLRPTAEVTLGENWLSSFADWAKVFLGIVLPLLLLAALTEAFVTPRIAIAMLTGS
jgi:uncharacterized membrane protein SpoIIM required for sporulation